MMTSSGVYALPWYVYLDMDMTKRLRAWLTATTQKSAHYTLRENS